MSRRRIVLIAAAFFCAAVLAVPAVHWRLFGWARNEPFYRGRPVTYWAGEVSELQSGYSMFLDAPAIECYRIDCLLPGLRRRLGWDVPTKPVPAADVPLGTGDPAAIPVLLSLLRGEDEQAKIHAAWALAVVGPPAREAAEPDLRRLAAREPRDAVAMTANDALRYVGAVRGR
jgi:hypothetical protein